MDVVVHTLVDTAPGRDGLVRRRVEVPPGSRVEAAAGPGGELWYVIDGAGLLTYGNDPAAPIRRDTALWLPAGARYRLAASAPAPLTLDSVTLPAGQAAGRAGMAGAAQPRLAELGDCSVETTGDRRFRVLFGPGNGCEAATQFVGEIPPGRAPLHSHTYDEVVLVLAGEGVLHAGPAEHPITPGTCIHLRPGQQHCLENTGPGTLWVLGVFHPGGSPAAKATAS
jgi:mannose-6-phosphate isomerase-like protein (cupin superfamily)